MVQRRAVWGDCLKEEASEPRLGNMEWGIEVGREGMGNHMEVEMLRTGLRNCG